MWGFEAFLTHGMRKVTKRLERTGCKCKSVCVHIKRSKPDAETWKHMGHGPCDDLARSRILAAYTSDADVVGTRETKGSGEITFAYLICFHHIVRLFAWLGGWVQFIIAQQVYGTAVQLIEQLEVPPTRVRGVGIQLQRLTARPPEDQSIAKFFGRPSEPSGREDVEDVCPVPAKSAARQPAQAHEALDMAVLAELPPELRAEVLRDYQSGPGGPAQDSAASVASPPPHRIPESPVQATPSRWDAAVIEELPSDLVAELRDQYRASMLKVQLAAPAEALAAAALATSTAATVTAAAKPVAPSFATALRAAAIDALPSQSQARGGETMNLGEG